MADDTADAAVDPATPGTDPSEQVNETDSPAEADETDGETDGVAAPETTSGPSHVRLATIAGLIAVVALAGLTGWLGYHAQKSRALDEQRQVFLQVGRQGALNLTTLDFEHIDADVQRVLDSATGTFYDDFQQRAASFADVVKQVKSKSVGTVSSAGLVEPNTPTEAQVLVAVTVKSDIAGQPEQPLRSWRMRITVQKVEDETKVSNVEFVP